MTFFTSAMLRTASSVGRTTSCSTRFTLAPGTKLMIVAARTVTGGSSVEGKSSASHRPASTRKTTPSTVNRGRASA